MMTESLNTVLEQLADEIRPVHSLDLAQLSDLGRLQVEKAYSTWLTLSAARRSELMSALVELAETNIHVNFHALLRACLSDSEARVRKLAIEGLWEDEKVSLIQPLIALLATDDDVEVRAAAAISLGRFVLLGVLGDIDDAPAQAAADALRAAWSRGGEPVEVRRRALEGLACTALAGLREWISDAYYDEDARMRQSALFAMGRSADPRWAKIVLAELGSPESPMRFEAAVAAGELGLARAVQPLIRRLDDPDGTVREAAVLALGKIGGAAARRALQALLSSEDERMAEAAEEALDEVRFNSEPIVEPLMDYSDRKSPAVRTRDAEDESDEEDDADEEDIILGSEDDEDDLDLYGEEILGEDEDLDPDDEGEDDLDWEDDDQVEDDQAEDDWR